MYSWGLVTSQTVFHETHQNLMMLCLGDNKGEELTGAQLRAEKDDAKKERNKIVCSWLSSPLVLCEGSLVLLQPMRTKSYGFGDKKQAN